MLDNYIDNTMIVHNEETCDMCSYGDLLLEDVAMCVCMYVCMQKYMGDF